VRGITQAKGLDGGVCQLALVTQISQYVAVVKKVRAVIDNGIFKQGAQVVVRLLDFGLFHHIGLKLDPRTVGQFL